MNDRSRRSSIIITATRLARILVYSDFVIMGNGLGHAVTSLRSGPTQDGVVQQRCLR
jgi:hypothetical protein